MFLSLQDQQFLASYKRTQDLENGFHLLGTCLCYMLL